MAYTSITIIPDRGGADSLLVRVNEHEGKKFIVLDIGTTSIHIYGYNAEAAAHARDLAADLIAAAEQVEPAEPVETPEAAFNPAEFDAVNADEEPVELPNIAPADEQPF